MCDELIQNLAGVRVAAENLHLWLDKWRRVGLADFAADVTVASASDAPGGQARWLSALEQLAVGTVNVEISGAGEGRLSGKVDNLRLSVSGKGKVGAEQLRAGTADVEISGVGNATLWAVKNLRVQISGAGHVEYWGTPEVTKSISGFGSVDSRGAKQ